MQVVSVFFLQESKLLHSKIMYFSIWNAVEIKSLIIFLDLRSPCRRVWFIKVFFLIRETAIHELKSIKITLRSNSVGL
jgi:hypothetical protein